MIKKLNIKNILTIAFVLVSVFFTPSTYAYGPERQKLFTLSNPANYVTFNSITDNPVIGDERDFVRVREVNGDKNTNFVNNLEISSGKIYEFYVAYHNNASSSLNQSGKGIAKNTRVRAKLPKGLLKDQKTGVVFSITADNASPKEVWDEVYLNTKEDLAFKYINDSAIIHTKYKDKFGNTVDGQILKNINKEGGALIGSSHLDGNLPGCSEFSGHITYRILAYNPKKITPSLKLDKKVSIDGKVYSESAELKDEGEVYYSVDIENNGKVAINNIKIDDKMPTNMEIVPGSITIQYNGSEKTTSLKSIKFNIEKLNAGSIATIKYKVKTSDVKCGDNTFENIITASYGNDTKSDSANLKIKKDCAPVAVPPPANTPNQIPETGPAEIAVVSIIIVGLGGGIAYFIYSKKILKAKMQKVTRSSSSNINNDIPKSPLN